MKEISLNILDITENSVKAGALLVEISILESNDTIHLTIKDNGSGMKEEVLKNVTDPFYTTRTTRKVGMGLPLLKLEAEMTGGNLTVISKYVEEYPCDHGTQVTTLFYKNHIDCVPLGDIVSSIITLIQGHPDIDFVFNHTKENKEIHLDTRKLREVLGDISLNTYEVIKWIDTYLKEQYI